MYLVSFLSFGSSSFQSASDGQAAKSLNQPQNWLETLNSPAEFHSRGGGGGGGTGVLDRLRVSVSLVLFVSLFFLLINSGRLFYHLSLIQGAGIPSKVAAALRRRRRDEQRLLEKKTFLKRLKKKIVNVVTVLFLFFLLSASSSLVVSVWATLLCVRPRR